MSTIKFKREDVAAKYETTVETDEKITTPDYDGMLSNAKLSTVEAMVKRNSPLVKAITVTKVAPPKS
jgi:hypothetical protein